MLIEKTNLPADDLFECARYCLDSKEPQLKCERTAATVHALREGRLSLDPQSPPQAIREPGRPLRPKLVAPRELARRRLGTPEGRASLLHALAHIEFNAINLAWDAVYRFRGMPEDFYRDWVRVAGEEAYHFRLLCERLDSLGYGYGDFDAHNGLWEMACTTAHDPLVRMALVPRVLEARGLDVTPGMMERLRKAGDEQSVAVLEIILHDEIGHVEIGTRWYRWLCAERHLDAEQTFSELLEQYMKGRVRGPFHYQAREQAGFNETEMAELERLSASLK